MGRLELHTPDSILDAARGVVVERGVRATTVAAIVEASQTPTGSIYHRFGSLQGLLARVWMRAVGNAQDAAMARLTDQDPVDDVVAAALGSYDFCLSHRDDARLLALFSLDDFLRAGLPAELEAELLALNKPAMHAAAHISERIFGTAHRWAVDLVLACAIDVPYGLVRTYLEGRGRPPSARREAVAAAVRGILTDARRAPSAEGSR